MYTAPVPQGMTPQIQQPASAPQAGMQPVGTTQMPHFAPTAPPQPYELRDRRARQDTDSGAEDEAEAELLEDDGSASLWAFRWFLPRSCGFLAQFLGQAQVIGYRPSRARGLVIAIYKRIYGLGLPAPTPPGSAPPATDAEAAAEAQDGLVINGEATRLPDGEPVAAKPSP